MLRVEVADVTADWAVVGEPLRAPTVPGEPLAWSDPWPRLVGDTAAYSTVTEHPGEQRGWRELVVPRADLAAAVGDRPLSGIWAAEALRIAAWRPRLGFETDHRTIPHEVDWLRTAVHLHKGCYRGQETAHGRQPHLGRPAPRGRPDRPRPGQAQHPPRRGPHRGRADGGADGDRDPLSRLWAGWSRFVRYGAAPVSRVTLAGFAIC